MSDEDTLIIDDYTQIVEYKSPESSRTGRVKDTVMLSDGGRHYHIPGVSNQYEIKFTTFIKKNDTAQLAHFDDAVYYNKPVTVVSTFANVKSGNYYVKDWTPKISDTVYLTIAWDLSLITNDDTTTELFGTSVTANLKPSTSEALNTDTTSFTNTVTVLKEGYTNKNQVKQIQRALQRAGVYVTAHGSKLSVDGVWGKYTTQAIQKFQKIKGLTVTGTINDATKKALGF